VKKRKTVTISIGIKSSQGRLGVMKRLRVVSPTEAKASTTSTQMSTATTRTRIN